MNQVVLSQSIILKSTVYNFDAVSYSIDAYQEPRIWIFRTINISENRISDYWIPNSTFYIKHPLNLRRFKDIVVRNMIPDWDVSYLFSSDVEEHIVRESEENIILSICLHVCVLGLIEVRIVQMMIPITCHHKMHASWHDWLSIHGDLVLDYVRSDIWTCDLIIDKVGKLN